MQENLDELAPIRIVKGLENTRFSKHAAQGAAIIADGLCEDGIYRELIENMRIKDSSGSNLDHVYISKLKDSDLKK